MIDNFPAILLTAGVAVFIFVFAMASHEGGVQSVKHSWKSCRASTSSDICERIVFPGFRP